MHPAERLAFSRVVAEFAQWRAVEDSERAPAAAWWWGPAVAVIDESTTMSRDTCGVLELPPYSSYAAGAAVLIAAISEQTSLPWPDDFPRKAASPSGNTQSTLADG